MNISDGRTECLVITQFQVMFNSNRYLSKFVKCPGHLSPHIGRPVAHLDASEAFTLVACEKKCSRS